MLTLGIDEVGRGPWAGPLVVGAVVLSSEQHIPGLRDSKTTTKKFREKEIIEIQRSAVAIGLGWIDPKTLDRVGMTRALHLAAAEAVNKILAVNPTFAKRINQIVIDGTGNFLEDFPDQKIREIFSDKTLVMPKADAKIAAVSAASIVAKVFRDNYMAQISQIFPDYDFANNAGYGVKKHRAALEQFGVIPGIHRTSFQPIKELLGEEVSPRGDWQNSQKLNSTPGRLAEAKAAEFLKERGHQILARDYKTPRYEIDIVSKKGQTIYFTEVKFRENDNSGDGMAAITSKKLNQMRFAAESFSTTFREKIDGFDTKLSAISLSGNPPEVKDYLESI